MGCSENTKLVVAVDHHHHHFSTPNRKQEHEKIVTMTLSTIVGGRKSVTTAVFMVLATLTLSMFPTNAGTALDLEAEATGDVLDCGDIIMLEDFSGPKHKWVEMNDPVMGGKSTGDFAVDETEHAGVFHGSVEIVSFLNAPGFIKAETTKGESWPDVSSCEGFQLTVRSETPGYEGFRVSFGSKKPPDAFPYTYGFKADLKLKRDDDTTTTFQSYKIPFDEFTDKWDAGTGDAVVTCSENKEFCPDEASKKDLYSIAVWGEGVEGEVDLRIQSIAAYGCSCNENAGIGFSSGSVSGDDFIASTSSSIEESAASLETGDGDSAVAVAVPTEDFITIEDFSSPLHHWSTMNDPVMGGRSTSSLSIEDDGFAHFEATCAIVPFLRAPGFVTMTTGRYLPPGEGPPEAPSEESSSSSSSSSPSGFPDVSTCQGLSLTMRTDVGYSGFYVSFGTDRAPGGRYAMGYKTHFSLVPGYGFTEVTLPFANFSSRWDDATGKTIVFCRDDPQYCPSLDNLRDMKTMSLWGEGVEGTFALDVESIGAYGCASGASYDGFFTPSEGFDDVVANKGFFFWSVRKNMFVMLVLVAAVEFGVWNRNRRENNSSFSASQSGYEEVIVVDV